MDDAIRSVMYTAKEAAAYLGVSPDCVYDQIKAGKPPVFHVGRCVRIPKARLHALVEHAGRIEEEKHG